MLSQTHQISELTLMKLQQIVRVQYKTDRIANSIFKLLQRTFSNGTLAELDKRFIITGEPAQLIEVSKQAIREVLDREMDNDDSDLLSHAWLTVYQTGLSRSVLAS